MLQIIKLNSAVFFPLHVRAVIEHHKLCSRINILHFFFVSLCFTIFCYLLFRKYFNKSLRRRQCHFGNWISYMFSGIFESLAFISDYVKSLFSNSTHKKISLNLNESTSNYSQENVTVLIQKKYSYAIFHHPLIVQCFSYAHQTHKINSKFCWKVCQDDFHFHTVWAKL